MKTLSIALAALSYAGIASAQIRVETAVLSPILGVRQYVTNEVAQASAPIEADVIAQQPWAPKEFKLVKGVFQYGATITITDHDNESFAFCVSYDYLTTSGKLIQEQILVKRQGKETQVNLLHGTFERVTVYVEPLAKTGRKI